MDKKALEKTKTAFIWILMSGALTTFLTGFASLLTQFRDGEVDMRYLGVTMLILFTNGLINVVAYYLYKSGRTDA